MQIEFRDFLTVKLIDTCGSDGSVIAAARVSTEGEYSIDYLKNGEGAGLINFLMKNRHGSPFEHNSITFFIKAPIFVFREFQRHRIGWSYNEESGRYTELDPVFYIPKENRNLVQIGKTGEYKFIEGNKEQYSIMSEGHKKVCEISYANYLNQLNNGICKEVARMSLPLNIYSSMYATCNTRSLMSFLGLRVNYDNAKFRSTPMFEIEQVGLCFENFMSDLFPLVHAAFVDNGYVAP